MATLVLLIAAGAAVDRLDADVIIDLGRGPVTTHVPPTCDPSEPDALGAMAIEASRPDLLFLSRIYNLEQDGSSGTFGQAMPAVAERKMIKGGE